MPPARSRLRRRLRALMRGDQPRLALEARSRSFPDAQWFWDHYDQAAGEIVEFCVPRQVVLAGAEIADVGCGDGIMALGLFQRVAPSRLVGFDVVPTDVGRLLERAGAAGVADQLPAGLSFAGSGPSSLPAPDGSFDFVYSWSAFEHIADPIGVLGEIRRVLRPNGRFFLQLWPFYHSAKGSHLWDWFPDDHHHLLATASQIAEQLEASDRHPPEWTRYMRNEFEHLNRITLDQLQRALLAAGFRVDWVELISGPTQLHPELARYAWADLAVGGIKLLAAPRG
jgi:ubiquinone/menaquinone biosynthesis C-methylase UbiE